MNEILAEHGGLAALAIIWAGRLTAAIFILIAGWLLGKWANKRIHAMHRLDGTLSNFLGGLAKYTIIIAAFITVIGLFGIPMASLLAVLGAAGLAIGLALQGTLSNVAAGVMLLILRPFNVGDYITFGGTGGTVQSLGLFGCELSMADNVYVFAPNSQIWGNEITNYSRNDTRRQDIAAGISYDDDINEAMRIIQGVLDAEPRLMRTEGKEPQIMVSGMGESAIDLIVRFWSASSDYWALKWDLTKAIKEALDQGGITIPFPTRTLVVSKEDLDKTQGGKGQKDAA